MTVGLSVAKDCGAESSWRPVDLDVSRFTKDMVRG